MRVHRVEYLYPYVERSREMKGMEGQRESAGKKKGWAARVWKIKSERNGVTRRRAEKVKRMPRRKLVSSRTRRRGGCVKRDGWRETE